MTGIATIVEQTLGRSAVTRQNSGCRSLSADEMLAYLQEHVHAEGDCLVWAGPFCGGTQQPKVMWRRKEYRARRLLLALSGVHVDGRIVYSVCGEQRCMNRAHLRAGTRADSNRQIARDGKTMTGARRSLSSLLGHAKRARLSVHDAQDVLRMRAEGVTLDAIGERYGVTAQCVSAAIKTWRRVGITEWRPLA